jgi:hypothetical protein
MSSVSAIMVLTMRAVSPQPELLYLYYDQTWTEDLKKSFSIPEIANFLLLFKAFMTAQEPSSTLKERAQTVIFQE